MVSKSSKNRSVDCLCRFYSYNNEYFTEEVPNLKPVCPNPVREGNFTKIEGTRFNKVKHTNALLEVNYLNQSTKICRFR